jgi:hypothetical protein
VVGAPDLLDNTGWGGTKYYLDPTNGNDGNSGLSRDDAFATLPTAFAAIPANENNILVYIAGTSSISLSAAFDWNKDYTHFVGETAPSGAANRARIFQAAAATGLSPLITVSAKGCIFYNIYTFQGVDDATSLINWSVTGGRNYFRDMHFAGGGHATMAIDNCASMLLNGAEENTFDNCRFGVTTIPLATGGGVIRWDGSSKENIFRDCRVAALIGNAGARLMEFVDGSAVDQVNWFFNTKFVSNSVNRATTMASAFEIPALTGATALGYFDLQCGGLGFTDWDDDNRGWAFFEGGTKTAGGNTGFALESNST